MTPGNHRKIRKIIAVLTMFRDEYAKKGDAGMSSKFSRATAILIDALQEDGVDDDSRES